MLLNIIMPTSYFTFSKTSLNFKALQYALVAYIIFRLLTSAWAFAIFTLNPRPYADFVEEDGQPRLFFDESLRNQIIAPWQRSDTFRYINIAARGYADPKNSVFPPLYPILIRWSGNLIGGGLPNYLIGAILVSNVCAIGVFYLAYKITAEEVGESFSYRTLIYLITYPAGFYFVAAYSESLFILLALTSVWQAKKGRFFLAGLLGILAALSRLTGALLFIPLFLAWWQFHGGVLWPASMVVKHPFFKSWVHWVSAWPTFLPILGSLIFQAYRYSIGLPSMNATYYHYWSQKPSVPGHAIVVAIRQIILDVGLGRDIALVLDIGCVIFLVITTYFVFKFIDFVWGGYNVVLLLFMLLPTSEKVPLIGYMRYVLPFLPSFMVLAMASFKNKWLHLTLLYSFPTVTLYMLARFFFFGHGG